VILILVASEGGRPGTRQRNRLDTDYWIDMLTLPKRADKSRFRLPTLALIVIGLVFLVVACGGSDSTSTAAPTESQTQPTTASSAAVTEPIQIGDRKVGGEVGNLAPEFSGINAWINSDPLTMEALRGQVVLIDF